MVRKYRTRSYAVLAISWLAGASVAMAGPLYGVNFTSAEGSLLFEVDTATGQASNLKPTGLSHLVGIAFSGNGTLYGLTNAAAPTNPNSLVKVNPDTGAAQVVGSTGLSDVTEGDLAWDRATAKLYGLYDTGGGARKLFTLNPATGAATPLPISLAGDPSAMAFDTTGNLYVIDTLLGKLLTVDKTTGTTLTSIAINQALGGVAGMAVDPATGIFYVADGETAGTNHLYTLDPLTGLLTDVGPTGLTNGPSGLAFIPEPASLVLIGLGASMLLRRNGKSSTTH